MFNFIKKIFKKPEQYDYEIIKRPRDVYEEDFRDELFNTCPVCGHVNEIYGGITDGTWSYYTCQNKECRSEWRVRE